MDGVDGRQRERERARFEVAEGGGGEKRRCHELNYRFDEFT